MKFLGVAFIVIGILVGMLSIDAIVDMADSECNPLAVFALVTLLVLYTAATIGMGIYLLFV